MEISSFPNPPAIPQDTKLANRIFGANCGPVSFAALLNTLVLDVIRYFPHFPNYPHTSIPQMKRAMDAFGVAYKSDDDWPQHGLCLIQFNGIWTKHGRYSEASKHRHWVAVSFGKIFDVNGYEWMGMEVWISEIMPRLMAAHPGRSSWTLAKAYSVQHS